MTDKLLTGFQEIVKEMHAGRRNHRFQAVSRRRPGSSLTGGLHRVKLFFDRISNIAIERMIHMKRTTQEILQEEVARERAATLMRAGERLAEALERLREIEREIAAGMALCGTLRETASAPADKHWRGPAAEKPVAGDGGSRRRFLRDLNAKIGSYNAQREHARIRYYYLIVVREALGMVHHQRLEEFYRIPPKKEYLPEG